MKERFNKMKKAFLIGLLVLTAASVVWAQWREKIIRVRIPSGATSAQYKDTLRGRISHIYVVRARAGQTMRVNLQAKEDDYISFQVRDPKGHVAESSNGDELGNSWENTLEQSGEYRISVGPPDTADTTDVSNYRIEITID